MNKLLKIVLKRAVLPQAKKYVKDTRNSYDDSALDFLESLIVFM